MENLTKCTKQVLIEKLTEAKNQIAQLEKDVVSAKEFASNKTKKELSHKEDMIKSLKKELECVRDSNTKYANTIKLREDELGKVHTEYKAKLNLSENLNKELHKVQVELNNANELIKEYSKQYDKHVWTCVRWFAFGVIIASVVTWLIFG